MNIRARREINLRLADMQKQLRGLPSGHLPGLSGGHDIVGQFANGGGKFGFRPQGGKWFDRSHIKLDGQDMPPPPRNAR